MRRAHAMRPTRMVLVAYILGSVAVLWCVAVFYLWRMQEGRLFPGNGGPFGPSPDLAALGGAPLRASREGQELRFHLVPAQGPARGWLLVYHGNAGGADERVSYAAQLAPVGLNVILAEYPGYANDPEHGRAEWPILRNSLAMYDE